MKVYAHWTHEYRDYERRTTYVIPGGEWRELPDDVAGLLLRDHAVKLCDVTAEPVLDSHFCPKSGDPRSVGYGHRMLEEPPADREMLPHYSAQKRRQRREAAQRSLQARKEVRG